MVFGSVYDSINESTLCDVAPYEFDESMSFQEMGAQMIEEATQDWNNYMEAVALSELSYVIENHQEYIYEGVDISAMLGKVKDWFKKLWSKIQGIAKAAMAKFMSWGKNDEGFINKYEKDIYAGAKRVPSGFSYKGYKFPGLKGKSDIVKSASKDLIKASEYDKAAIGIGYGASSDKVEKEQYSSKSLDKLIDKHRATITGKSGSVSGSEFKKELKKFLYGSLDKEYMKDANAADLITIVKGAKEAQSAAKDAENAIKDDIDEKINIIDDLESEIRSKSDEQPATQKGADERDRLNGWASAANRYSQYLKSIESVNAQWFSAYITALKDQNRQAKSVCVKLVSYANGVGGKKEDSTNESASLLEGRFQELLDF